MLRDVRPDDSTSICEIYNHYIRESPATFEEISITPEDMRERIADVTRQYPWFVCEEEGALLGYAYGRRWHERAAYRHSVEAGVYLHPLALGKRKGSALMEALLAELRKRQYHTIIGGVALPNEASVALLQRFGFHKVAHYSEVGYKFGRWIDVGYWQLLL